MAISNMLSRAWEYYLWEKRQDGVEFEKIGPVYKAYRDGFRAGSAYELKKLDCDCECHEGTAAHMVRCGCERKK